MCAGEKAAAALMTIVQRSVWSGAILLKVDRCILQRIMLLLACLICLIDVVVCGDWSARGSVSLFFAGGGRTDEREGRRTYSALQNKARSTKQSEERRAKSNSVAIIKL